VAQEKLTRETVVDQALALADDEGVEAVTIRRLASLLGVTPMALYWHFKNKDELMWALADHMLLGVTADISPGDTWQKRLRVMVEALIRVMREHPCLPALLAIVEDKHDVESFQRATEAALDVLTTAGFTLRESFYISSYLLNGSIALVRYQPTPPLRLAEEAETRRQRRLKLESLPCDRFPRMVEYGATLAKRPDIDQYFTLGTDLLLAGIETLAQRHEPSG
jgi:TetR/AcrR family tetracycline transcriptional repressor